MEYISNLFYTFFDKIAVGLKVYLNSNTYIVGKDDEELSRQISSYFRFTYRYGFETIEGTKLSSDSGWGCMARVAQMMMARVLYLHLMGKDWIFSKANISPEKWVVHNQILKWFMDFPDPECYYSIHHIAQCGARYGTPAGDWFRPSSISLVIRDLCQIHHDKGGLTLKVYVSTLDAIFLSDVDELFSEENSGEESSLVELVFPSPRAKSTDSAHSSSSSSWSSLERISQRKSLSSSTTMLNSSKSPQHPEHDDANSDHTHLKDDFNTSHAEYAHDCATPPFFDPLFIVPPKLATQDGKSCSKSCWKDGLLVLMPLQLAEKKVSEFFHEKVQEVLKNPYCVGILGGRPNHALYFVGCREDGRYVGFDPHTNYSRVSSLNENEFPSSELMDQVHVSVLNSIVQSQLDPSMAIAFYFPSKQDFISFCRQWKENQELASSSSSSSSTTTTTAAAAASSALHRTSLFTIEKYPPSIDSLGDWDVDSDFEELNTGVEFNEDAMADTVDSLTIAPAPASASASASISASVTITTSDGKNENHNIDRKDAIVDEIYMPANHQEFSIKDQNSLACCHHEESLTVQDSSSIPKKMKKRSISSRRLKGEHVDEDGFVVL